MSELGPLTGEPLALDLVNSDVRLTTGPIDFLADLSGLRRWLECEAERLDGVAPAELARPRDADLAAVRDLRGHTVRAVEAARHGESPSRGDLTAITEAARAAPLVADLVAVDGGVRLTRRRAGAPGSRIAAELADAVATTLADPTITRVRKCEADFCVLLFLPTNPRRLWCSPRICGNRVRVARHQRRRRVLAGGD